MSYRKILVLCFVAFASLVAVQAQEQAYLPQVANGTYSGGSMRTTFVLFNPTDLAATVTVFLTNDAGDALTVTIPGQGTGAQFGPLTLQPGQTMFLQTDGTGPLTVGAARVQSSVPIGVSAVFTIFDAAQQFVTEAGVNDSPPLDQFVIPVDSTGLFETSVALFNFDTDATVTYRLVELNGTQVATTGNPKTEPLLAGDHLARTVVGENGLFPDVTNFRGTLVIESSQPIAAHTIRQKNQVMPLSNTTLPVVSSAEDRTSFNLSQVANGLDQLSGLTMATTFVVVNVSGGAVTVNFNLRKSDSTPMPVTISGVANNTATFSVNLPAGGSAFLQTDGSGALAVGSAEVTSNGPVGVAGIFTLYGPGQTFLTEAGVPDSPTKMMATLPVDMTGNFSTGVALFNPTAAPVSVQISLFDEAGVKVGDAAPLVINPKSQQARFVEELFPGQTDSRGSLGITALGGIAAMTLRQNAFPLSYTSLPVVDGVSQGNAGGPAAALLDETRTGVNGTANATVNVQLQAGFKLSGTVTGAQFASSVVARNTTGGQFVAALNILTSQYLVVVPAGSYTLHVCYIPQTGSFQDLPSLSFADPNPVQVNADTTRNITIPAQTLNLVSGSVAGIDQLPTNGGVLLSLSTADGTAGGFVTVAANGSYQIQLPNGTYTASLVVSNLTFTVQGSALPSQQQSMSNYNIGSVVVNSAPVTANFTLPARTTLLGIARRAGIEEIPPNSFVLATDTSGPQQQTMTCNFPATASQTIIDVSDPDPDVQKAFQLMLASGRSYRLTVTFPVGSNGTVTSPTEGLLVSALGTTQFLDVPALPGNVTISGTVTDPQGQPVSGVSVTAFSQQITGAANITFSTFTTTNATGNYSLTVLSGTGYTLFFSPPRPQP